MLMGDCGRLKRICRSLSGAIVVLAVVFAMSMGIAGTAHAGETNASETIQVQSDVPYMAPWSAAQTQKLDLYSLKSWDENGENQGHPLVVFLHGGSWVHGDKSMSERMPLVEILLKSGYAVASIDYRLTEESPWPAQINDCKSAIRFLRANAQSYGVDGKRIAVFGESAGAHLAMLMDVTSGEKFVNKDDGNGSVSADVQAVISDYGISDVGEWGTSPNDDSVSAEYAKNLLLGEGYTDGQAMLASPIDYVNAEAKPILLVHGKNDTIVSYHQTATFEQRLRAAGAGMVYSWYPDDGPHSSIEVFVKNIDAQLKYLNFLSNAIPEKSVGKEDLTTVVRMYDGSNGNHIFSDNENEINVLDQNWTNWRNEGAVFSVRHKSFNGDQSVTRLHNLSNGDYLYTVNPEEISSLSSDGWILEGTFKVPAANGLPVYRLYNPNMEHHMLTTTDKEKSEMIEQGWQYEGIAFYAYPAA